MELTEKNIRAATPGAVLKDGVVKGLQLRCFECSKSFYLYYRTKAGAQRKPKLGDWGQITLTQARKVAQELMVEVAAGRDPSAIRADARAEPTVADLWEQYWKRRGSKKKSAEADDRKWRLHIQPRFGKLRLKEVTYTMVADMHDAMIDTPYEANRVLALLSVMFNFACHPLEWIDRNPVKGVRRYREEKRRRYMKGEEAARIAELLDANAAQNPASVAFLYLLILTGARRGEIAAARWDWIKGNVIHLPDSKTGEKQVYLPPQALDVLDRLPRTTGTITGLLTPTKFWERIREEAGCPDLRMHDLRHSFASAALSAGLSLAQIGELLGHKSTQTTKRYAHLVDDVATAAATAAADNIMATMKKAPAEAEAKAPQES